MEEEVKEVTLNLFGFTKKITVNVPLPRTVTIGGISSGMEFIIFKRRGVEDVYFYQSGLGIDKKIKDNRDRKWEDISLSF